MQFQRLKIKNFRNVPDQDLELNGCNVLCYGDNGVGKSNLITCVHALLSAKFPPGSIRKGASQAEVEAILADFTRGDDPSTWVPIEGTEHRMRAVVKTGKKGEQVVDIELHYPDGGADDQVTKVRTYLGQKPMSRNFVELSRTEPGKAEQLKILRSMFPEETQETLRKLETRIRLAEKDRLGIGQSKTTAEGSLKKSTVLPDDLDKYTIETGPKGKKVRTPNKIDVVTVVAEKQTASDHNTKLAGVLERRNERLTTIGKIEKQIEGLQDSSIILLDQFTSPSDLNDMRMAVGACWTELKGEFETKMKALLIKKLKEEITGLEKQNKEVNAWAQKNPVIDLKPFDEKLAKASTHNSMADKVMEYIALMKEVTDLTNQYGELDALVNSTRETFKATVRSFDLPVPGLSFDDTTVTYNGKPADEQNTSTAERMMIDAMLTIHEMGKAQVLFMDRGESLGKANYKELMDLCDANGIQVFLEQVERQDDKELRVVVECPSN